MISYPEFLGSMFVLVGIILGGVKMMLNGFEKRSQKEFDGLWARVNHHSHFTRASGTDQEGRALLIDVELSGVLVGEKGK